MEYAYYITSFWMRKQKSEEHINRLLLQLKNTSILEAIMAKF